MTKKLKARISWSRRKGGFSTPNLNSLWAPHGFQTNLFPHTRCHLQPQKPPRWPKLKSIIVGASPTPKRKTCITWLIVLHSSNQKTPECVDELVLITIFSSPWTQLQFRIKHYYPNYPPQTSWKHDIITIVDIMYNVPPPQVSIFKSWSRRKSY